MFVGGFRVEYGVLCTATLTETTYKLTENRIEFKLYKNVYNIISLQ